MIPPEGARQGDYLASLSRPAGIAAVSSAIAVAAMDYLLPANYCIPTLYGIALSLGAITRSARLLWGLGAACLALTAARMWLPPP